MIQKRVENTGLAVGSRESSGGKLLNLHQAVERYVSPGITLHLAGGIGGPSAAICEIIRQYWNRDPRFTLVQSTVTGHSLNLVHAKLVKRLICAVCADISESARPSRIVQTAHETGQVELENWSLNSLQQRLMAGAFGVPFMPTRSVLKSSIASDNGDFFRDIEDPFKPGERVGIVNALCPDISIIHGCVADLRGNTILSAPAGEDLWGALASRNGAVVTVEKIVPVEFIREYASLVKIPAYAVNAVVVAPMGLHPFSIANPGVRSFEPYEMDTNFLNDLHDASSSDEALDAWIKEWILDCASHRQYLKKIGKDKIAALKNKPGDRKRAKGVSTRSDLGSGAEFDRKEMMLVALAREILDSVDRQGHELVLAGAGFAATAAFLAYYHLKSLSKEIDLVAGNGQIGYIPVPGESILASEAGVRSSKMLTDTVMTQGVIVGGMNNKCLAVLGAGQIDRYGNINSTKTSKGKFLVGSGGANDALNAREIILSLDQSKRRFVEKLAYITGCGNGVTKVVSTMGILKKMEPGEELHLVACFPDLRSRRLSESVREIRDNCGWELKVSPIVEEIARPSEEELKLVRWLLAPK
jgi:acyl CoA:acetate/3-ketoacid CoA transferase alpha subunit/acyl CoA:acetate/3-ketoacid CoA transferase beta subunit